MSAESLAKYSGFIGRALLVHCQKARHLAGEPASAIYLAALNCLHEMVHGFCQHHPSKLARLLMAMNGVERPTAGVSMENQIGNVLKHFKDLLNHLLSGRENEDIVAKAVLPVIGVLTILSNQVDPATIMKSYWIGCKAYAKMLTVANHRSEELPPKFGRLEIDEQKN